MIGRGDTADIALIWDAAVSRRHAVVLVADGAVSVRDLGSRNGTFHNGVRLAADDPPASPRRVRPSDQLRCGDTVLALTRPPNPGSPPDPNFQTRTATA